MQIGQNTLTAPEENAGSTSGLDWLYRASVSSAPWTVGTPIPSFTMHTQSGTPFTNLLKHASLLFPFAFPTYTLPAKVAEAGDLIADRTWTDVGSAATDPKVFVSVNTLPTASQITGYNFQRTQQSPVVITNEYVAVRIAVADRNNLGDLRLAVGTSYEDPIAFAMNAASVTSNSSYVFLWYRVGSIPANTPVRMQRGSPLQVKKSVIPADFEKTPRRVATLSEDGAFEGEIIYLTADYNVNHVDITPVSFSNTFLDGEGLGTRGFLRDDASGAGARHHDGRVPLALLPVGHEAGSATRHARCDAGPSQRRRLHGREAKLASHHRHAIPSRHEGHPLLRCDHSRLRR